MKAKTNKKVALVKKTKPVKPVKAVKAPKATVLLPEPLPKSIINCSETKKLVIEMVEKALIECSYQHESHAHAYMGADGRVYPTADMLRFAKTQPTVLKMAFTFYWDSAENPTDPKRMVCQPVLDLSKIKGDQ